jgi:hypothetical protein
MRFVLKETARTSIWICNSFREAMNYRRAVASKSHEQSSYINGNLLNYNVITNQSAVFSITASLLVWSAVSTL